MWDLLTKSPEEITRAKIGEYFSWFWQGFDDLALIGFMVCLFLWMFSVPKMGKATWVLVAVYVTIKVLRVAI